MQERTLNAIWLGERPYAETYALQVELFELRRAGRIEDTLLLLEHFPVVTLGTGSHDENLLLGRSALAGASLEDRQIRRKEDAAPHH